MSNHSVFASISTYLFVGASWLLVACPADDTVSQGESSSGEVLPTTASEVCVPGQQVSCPCPGGVDGIQVCAPDGSSFGLCECAPPPDTTTTTTTTTTTGLDSSSSGTGGSTTDDTGTTDTGGESSESTSTGGGPSVCDMYMSPPGFECDLWLQDCPAGEKCMPWNNGSGSSWNSVRCSPLEPMPGQIGDSCTVQGSGTSGLDDCDLGLMCWDVDSDTNIGTCIELCNGCPDDASCSGGGTACVVTNDDILPLCLEVCDPLLQDCGGSQACYPVEGVFLCAPDASGALGAYGDPCEFINVCDPGLACLEPTAVPGCPSAVGCCTEFCDVADPAGDAQCSGVGGGQTCQAWYAAGMAPAGFEDVGICTL